LDRDFFERYRINVEELQDYARTRDIDRIINTLEQVLDFRHDFFPSPDYLFSFIKKIVDQSPIDLIIDPYASFGLDAVRLANAFPKSNITALVTNPFEASFLELIGFSTDRLRLIPHDPLLFEPTDEYDLVYSLPPMHWSPQTEDTKLFPDQRISDYKDRLIILKYSKLLKQTGYAFFLTTPTFFYERRRNKVISNLEKNGLFIHIALQLPANSLFRTTITPYLILVRKTRPDQLFVGRLTQDTSDIVASNFLQGKNGKTIELGHFTNLSEFTSLDVLVRNDLIEKTIRRKELTTYSLKEITHSINSAKKGDTPFIETSNNVFLPLFTTGKAVYSTSQMLNKPHNYLQLDIDPKKAMAQYIAEFYNSDLGRNVRDNHRAGIIPKISKRRLLESNVYLPSIQTQINFIKALSDVRDIETQILTLKNSLIENPNQTSAIKELISRYHVEESFPDWIDTLPFPLASILWSYYTKSTFEEKTRTLLFFFEALAIFNSTILLSGFLNNPSIKQKYAGLLLGREFSTLNRATFGTWVHIGFKLAKEIRTLIDNDEKDQLSIMFSNANSKFTDMICNKKLLSSISTGNEYRNNWIGHTGATSDKEWENRHTIISDTFSLVKSVISDNYSTTKLILPGKNDHYDGIFTYEISILMGTRTPFLRQQYDLLSPMDANTLHFIHDNSRRPFKLVPFFQITDSPQSAKNACYFYNRLDGDQAKFISYHFDTIPEKMIRDNRLLNLIRDWL